MTAASFVETEPAFDPPERAGPDFRARGGLAVARPCDAGNPSGTINNMPRNLPVRRIPLAEEGRDDDMRRFSPTERVAMMWQLALQAWMFKEGLVDEPRLRRDVVRTVRGRR